MSIRIEAIDKIRATDDDGRDLHMEPGDIRTVGANIGALACASGWAKDADGVIPTGEKSRDSVMVSAQNVVIDQGAESA